MLFLERKPMEARRSLSVSDIFLNLHFLIEFFFSYKISDYRRILGRHNAILSGSKRIVETRVVVRRVHKPRMVSNVGPIWLRCEGNVSSECFKYFLITFFNFLGFLNWPLLWANWIRRWAKLFTQALVIFDTLWRRSDAAWVWRKFGRRFRRCWHCHPKRLVKILLTLHRLFRIFFFR